MSEVRFADGRTIRVSKIVCLGANYGEHNQEMKREFSPPQPLLFLKPATAIIHDGETIEPPPFSSSLHHEVELVAVIGKEGKHISAKNAMEHITGYAVGLDMTLRDVQDVAKKKGHPWSVAKGFDTSAPISDAVPAQTVTEPHKLDIQLKVNGNIRQKSNTSKMVFKLDYQIAYISSIFKLEKGDLIFTGTPEGVSQVASGDIIEGHIEKVGTVTVKVR
jgi:2-keto-4-pentenoate hydratase/2-oxohepta-3-ene-1,7-dioic acid hydratase in catechol pathway